MSQITNKYTNIIFIIYSVVYRGFEGFISLVFINTLLWTLIIIKTYGLKFKVISGYSFYRLESRHMCPDSREHRTFERFRIF